jgi:hypothetical protein
MTMLTQDTKATDPQIKQITRVATDAAEKAVADYIAEFGLDKDGAQRVHANGHEITAAIRSAIFTSYKELSVSDRFKDEEVKSTFGYLSGYKKPKGITEQTNILRQAFPGIGFADEKIAQGEVPKGAEGWFAIPKWETMAETYGEAVQKVIDAIKKSRNGKFFNYREGELGPDQLRQSARTTDVFQKLTLEQKDHDILVVPAQFGLRHRGRSVRRVREVLLGNEFGLGAFAVGIMILTHPERLMNYDDLWIDCAGDEFAPDADGKFSGAPCFGFDDDEVEFGTGDVSIAGGRFGTASGFSPQ